MTIIHKLINRLRFIIFGTSIKGRSNKINIKCIKQKTTMIINGNNNFISVPNSCTLNNTSIDISGDNNSIIIKDKARLIGPCRIIMQGNSTLVIGENSGIRGVDFLLNNADIIIGKLCMFSNNIIVRNHDSHKVINSTTNVIENSSKEIILGNHVWVGQNVTILKGVKIGDNSIIAMGSVVTKSCEDGCIMAGNPAKKVKDNISWDY